MAGVRDAIVGVGILVVAIGILLFAIAFALLAAFWALAEVLPNWQAALVMAGASLVAALILRAIGVHMIRRRARRNGSAAASLKDFVPDASASLQQSLRPVDSITLITLAVLAGVVVGRRISK